MKYKQFLDFWGSNASIEILESIYGHQRFDSNDPAMFIAHGTEDTTVPFSSAEDLKTICETNEVEFYLLSIRRQRSWSLGSYCERKKFVRFIF